MSRPVIPTAVLSNPAFNVPAGVDKSTVKFGRTGTEGSLALYGTSGGDVPPDVAAPRHEATIGDQGFPRFKQIQLPPGRIAPHTDTPKGGCPVRLSGYIRNDCPVSPSAWGKLLGG